ncbi:invasion associated locus B family protein [Brucella pseudogrignonensis]
MRKILFVLWSIVICGGQPAWSNQVPIEAFKVKPSIVALPAGAEPGSYRRVIRPFENWDLICDEDLKAMNKICNVTQTIEDDKGSFVFSWSLAATEAGKPMLILRVPADVIVEDRITLRFDGQKQTLSIKVGACDVLACTAFVSLVPIIRTQIENNAPVSVSYRSSHRGSVVLDAPTRGLSAAVAAIE